MKYILIFLLYLYLGTGFFIGVRVQPHIVEIIGYHYKGEKFKKLIQCILDFPIFSGVIMLETFCWFPMLVADFVEGNVRKNIKRSGKQL